MYVQKMASLILILILSDYKSAAQKFDYLVLQDSLTSLTCGKQDADNVNRTILKLEAFDTNVLGKNIQHYYYDLGMAYYTQYAFLKDTGFLRKSINVFEKALFHKPKFSGALWNLSLDYALLNNCPKSLYYLNRHKKATSKRKWLKDQFKYIEKKCGMSLR